MSLLRDHETERALLAAVLVAPSVLPFLLNEEQLRPEHFSQGAEPFAAMVSITDRGDALNVLTLAAELDNAGFPQARELAHELAGMPLEAESARTFARRIRDLARRRELKLAATLLSEAADLGDADKLQEAEALLTTPADADPSTWTGKQLAERYADRMDAPAPERFAWPFEALNKWTGGGLRRQQIVLIGGWTAAGKSVVYDQALERFAKQGLRVHSYINEMSEEERMDRTVARLSGVPFSKVYAKAYSPEQGALIYSALSEIKVGITECAGWTAPEIARHIRWNRWDVAGVDILHEIAHREERDLAEIAQTLRSAAKSVGCALVACVHLNDNRVTTPQRPVPVLRDVRGSGMLVRGADIVLFVHRDDDADGVPQPSGVLLASKIRNGQPSAMGVEFDPEHMRFLPRDRDEPVSSRADW